MNRFRGWGYSKCHWHTTCPDCVYCVFSVRVLSEEEEKDYSFFVPICTTTNNNTKKTPLKH